MLGNGGQIRINAASGNAYVNKLAVIDFSAGSVAGNGGTAYIDAFGQLGFYGILNGRAPPGFTPGKAFLDPETVSIGDVYLQLNSVMYVDAWRDIFITGPIYLGHDAVLELHADSIAYTQGEYRYFSWDTQYDPGIGAIYNSGDFGIYASDTITSLSLYAGSGIGTLDHPILTNVSDLRVVINPEAADAGDVFIEQGSEPLYAEIYAPRSMVVLTCGGPLYSSTDGTAITADELYIEAEGGIGEYVGDGIYYPLTVDVNKLVAVNQGYGSIILESDNDLNILALINDAYEGGDVDVYANGDLTVTYGIRANGYITLTAENNLYLCEFADITGNPNYDIYLTALNGRIGLIPEAGLLGYWNFDQYSSYTVYDQVTGQYSYWSGNPYQVEGGVGGSMAMFFDGAGDYINTGRYFGLGTGDFTLTAWYRGTQTAPYIGIIGATPGMNVGYTLENHNGYARYWLSRETFDSAVAINDGSWHQLSMVRENMEGGSEGSLYIIGPRDPESDQFGENVYFEDFSVAQDSVDSSVPFWIGGWGNTGRLTQGAIDEVRVYDRALSGLELYAQTLIAPGSGRVSAGYVELEAQTGIDIGFGYVRDFFAANASGDLRIDSIGDLTINGGDGYSSVDYHDGPISLICQGDIYVNDDLYTTGDYDIYLSAEGTIEVAEQVSIYSANDPYQPQTGDIATGDVTLSAGQDIVFAPRASVGSSASSSVGNAVSGDIVVTAGGSMDLDWPTIYSNAQSSGAFTGNAQSGGVRVEAGNTISLHNGGRIYSSAAANHFTEEGYTSGTAQSGAVIVTGDYGISSVYDPGAEDTGAFDFYSQSIVQTTFAAQAYASCVLLNAEYGNIDLAAGQADVFSSASAQGGSGEGASAVAAAGSWYYDYESELYYEYLAVLIEAGGSIALADRYLYSGPGYNADGYASAYQSSSTAGDVLLNAGQSVTTAQHLLSDSRAYAQINAAAVSGDVTVASEYGQVNITTIISSNASADVVLDGGSAYATSGDVEVSSLYGPVNAVSPQIASSAEAYGDYAISPAYLQASAGNVTISAGGALTLNESSVDSNTHTSSNNAQDIYFEAGDITLAGGSIDIADCQIYSGVSYDGDIPAVSGTATVISGDIIFEAGEGLLITGTTEVVTRAGVQGIDGAAASLTAQAGAVLMDCYGDIILGSEGAQDYLVHSRAQAYGADALSVVAGEISLDAGGDIYVGFSNYAGYALDATASSVESEVPGDLSFYAAGSISLTQNLRAHVLSLVADSDWNGEGALVSLGEFLSAEAESFIFAGAQDFYFDGVEGLWLDGGEGFGASLDTPPGVEPALSVASTLENTLTIGSLPDPQDMGFSSLRFYSAGDLYLNENLTAGQIDLVADFDQDGYGNLFGYIDLTAGSHRLQSAGDITIIENRVYCGEEGFNAYLAAPDGYFGDLDIRSTAGSVTVTTVEGNVLSRAGGAGISLRAQGDIVIEAPVSVEYGGLSLISDAGSLVGGIDEGLVHITAASDVYLQAGDWYAGEAPSNMVGSLDAPLAILVGEGEVSVRVHGQTEGVSGNLTGSVNGSSQADAIAVVNDAPGVVYFNNAPAPEPEEPVVPGPGPDPYPQPDHGQAYEFSLPELTGQVIANQPEVVDGTVLDQFQVSSPMGMLFAYHPLSDADTSAFDQFATVAGDYLLSNGQLQYVGRSNLLPFFEQLDLKRKNPAAL